MATETGQGEDHPEDLEFVEEEETAQEVVNRILETPNVLEALQNQRTPAEMMALLPASVKRRIKALKKIQLEATNIEAKFFKEVHDLECKYHKLYIPLYEKRNTIVNGSYEPNDEEAQWPSDDENDLPEAIKEKIKLEEEKDNKEKEKDEKGVPEFWLTIFRNCTLFSEMVQPHDVPILKHLTDIKTFCKEDPMVSMIILHSPYYIFNLVIAQHGNILIITSCSKLSFNLFY